MENNMRTILLLAFAVLSQTAAATDSDDEATLRHLKTVLWNQAYRTQDVELLDSILHDTFEMIDGDGNRSTKQKELDYIANNQWDPGTFEYRIERLIIYDDKFAIVDGTGIATNYTYKSSNYLIKEDGRWQAVSSHVSGRRSKSE